ncbi:hypothetical protein LTS08_004624 [Lithohypha guttulata]|nr:hypothetical protein LTS08_004624 [Lithohypha guttulata]
MAFILTTQSEDISALKRAFPVTFRGDWCAENFLRVKRRGLHLQRSMTKARARQKVAPGIIAFDRPAGPPDDAPEEAVVELGPPLLPPKGETRKFSLRRLEVKDDPNAELLIDLCNIRKKLNWKTNRPSEDSRPAKRPRLESIPCHAHLTIWDNTPGSKTKSSFRPYTRDCEVLKSCTDFDAAVGDFIEVKLEEPFRIPKRDLRVEAFDKGERRLDMAKEYFIEIKIQPTRDDLRNWPPMKLLGKSEGDQSAKMDKLAKKTLEGCLVARHRSLTPDSQTPLSLFFYAEGICFKTKYGLEIDSKWMSTEDISSMPKKRQQEEDSKLESWMMDEDGLVFGKVKPVIQKSQPSKAVPRTLPLKNALTNGILSRVKRTVKYKIEPNGAEGRFRKYREAKVEGFSCYSCGDDCSKTIEQLLEHLRSVHYKYDYIVEDTKTIESQQLAYTEIIIRVADPNFKPRKLAQKTPTQLEFVEDMSKYPLSALRKQYGGFLPPQHVPPCRPAIYTRRKYSNTRVSGKGGEMTSAFTSTAVRPVVPEDPDEESRSESEDETDDRWFLGKHLEKLDVYAHEQNWSDARRRLAKKWAYHLMHRERSPHARYISDSLIRFVRIEKQWILRKSKEWATASNRGDLEMESVEALEEFMYELMMSRVINKAVCSNLLALLEDDKEAVPLLEEEKHIIDHEAAAALKTSRRQQRRNEAAQNYGTCVKKIAASDTPDALQRRLHKVAISALPPNLCGACQHDLEQDNPTAVRCSSIACPLPGTYYHRHCAGLKRIGEAQKARHGDGSLASTVPFLLDELYKARSEWKCQLCQGEG